MSSTRLPGKVLKPVLDEPMIARLLERLSHSKKLDNIIIATSDDTSDDPIDDVVTTLGYKCFRGNLDDVLDRFYRAAQSYGLKGNIVRITGDCPLVDWRLVDDLIDYFSKHDFDYCLNCDPPTLPDGLDCEVFTFASLEKAWQLAKKQSEREHVTPFIADKSNGFKISNLSYEADYSHYRWTVDETEDYEFVRKIYEALYPVNPDFAYRDILEYLSHNPDVIAINAQHQRNAGYADQIREENKHA